MSCFTTVDSSEISSAGSSNMPVRRASCASFCSFWLVLWMPTPMRAARRANSLCEPPPADVLGASRPLVVGRPCAAARRDTICWNSAVRSRTLAPAAARILVVC